MRTLCALLVVFLMWSARVEAISVFSNGQGVFNPNDARDFIGVAIPYSIGVAVAAATAPAVPSAGDVSRGAMLVQANGCMGCHGANVQGKIGPALYGIENKLAPGQIAEKIAHPIAPMPNFGFTQTQIGDIVAYLSSLDGGTQSGAQGAAPVVTFTPAAPTGDATISIRFSGTVPQHVNVFPIMQMGASAMQSKVIVLKRSPSDPSVFTGRIEFSMGGPWVVRIEYDGHTMNAPIDVGSGE